jgi:hypothetical protein
MPKLILADRIRPNIRYLIAWEIIQKPDVSKGRFPGCYTLRREQSAHSLFTCFPITLTGAPNFTFEVN